MELCIQIHVAYIFVIITLPLFFTSDDWVSCLKYEFRRQCISGAVAELHVFAILPGQQKSEISLWYLVKL